MTWLRWLPTAINGVLLVGILSVKWVLVVYDGYYEWHFLAWRCTGIASLLFIVSGVCSLFMIRKQKLAALVTLLTSILGILLVILWHGFYPNYG